MAWTSSGQAPRPPLSSSPTLVVPGQSISLFPDQSSTRVSPAQPALSPVNTALTIPDAVGLRTTMSSSMADSSVPVMTESAVSSRSVLLQPANLLISITCKASHPAWPLSSLSTQTEPSVQREVRSFSSQGAPSDAMLRVNASTRNV